MNELLGFPNNIAVNENFLPTVTLVSFKLIFIDTQDEPFQDFYDATRDPGVSIGFSTAAYRLHTFVGGHFTLSDSNFKVVGNMLLRDVFHKPLSLLENSTYDDLMRFTLVFSTSS